MSAENLPIIHNRQSRSSYVMLYVGRKYKHRIRLSNNSEKKSIYSTTISKNTRRNEASWGKYAPEHYMCKVTYVQCTLLIYISYQINDASI
jgi:hypothetical protein